MKSHATMMYRFLSMACMTALICLFAAGCKKGPVAIATVSGDDGSLWEQVSLAGFGDKNNVSIVSMCEFKDSIYAVTRNDVTGFQIWRTAGLSWEQVQAPGFTDSVLHASMNNVWGDMIVFNDKLYVAVSSGIQGSKLYKSIGFEIWRYDGTNDGIIYHSGNIAQNAAALMAVQAGLYVPQWVASLPGLPNAAYPQAIWNGTTGRYDGGLVCIISTYAMYQNQGGSWVAVGSNWAIFGQVQIGQLAVASVAASALVSDLVMSTVIRTSGSIFSTSGTRYPTGVLMSGNAFTTYYQDGTQDTNCHLEIDGSVNIGGYKAAVIANRVMGNSPSWTSNSTWTCPEGITKVSLTLQGAGANGAAGVSVGNAGGGGGCGAYLQRSITVTPGTVYYISFDSGTVNFRTGGYSGTILYSAAIGGAASAPTHGNNGSAYYQPTPELLVPIPTTAGIDGQPWTGSGPTINYGGAGGISPFDASGYGSGGKGQDILKAGGVSGVAGTGMPGFARIIY